jgi:hypothetical protein
VIAKETLVACLLVVVHLGAGAGGTLGVVFVLDLLRKRCGVGDAFAFELPGDTVLDHLAGRSELATDDLGLPHDRVEHDVLGTICIDEVAAEDFLRRLEFSVDASVALLEAGGIPRQIEMDEVAAAGLQIDALASGIGADQDADGLDRRFGVEGALDLLAAVEAGRAGEDADPLVAAIGIARTLP